MTEMPASEYAAELSEILELRDVPAAAVTRIVRDVQSHVAESGQDPVVAFGSPSQYAERAKPRSASLCEAGVTGSPTCPRSTQSGPSDRVLMSLLPR